MSWALHWDAAYGSTSARRRSRGFEPTLEALWERALELSVQPRGGLKRRAAA